MRFSLPAAVTFSCALLAGCATTSEQEQAEAPAKEVLASPVSPGVPRGDKNSQAAHEQLVAKAKSGRIDLYFLGDSITRRWGATDYPDFLAHFKSSFHGWNAGNFGWGADKLEHMLWRIQNGELDGVNPKVIVFLGGTNNVGQNPKPGTVEEVVNGTRDILTVLRQKAPRATILLMAVLPRNDSPAANPVIEKINAELPKLADGKRIRFVNINNRLAGPDGTLLPGMAVDNLHLGIPGYEVWASELKPILEKLLGPRAATDLAPAPTGDPRVK